MYDHKLGKTSKKVFDTLHPDLQMIVSWGLKYCAVDASYYEGHRPQEKQFGYYKKGREFKNGRWVIVNKKAVITNVDGYRIKGKHNYNPSHAVDFCVYVPEKDKLKWDSIHLTYIAASLVMIAEMLYLEGLIEHKLRWGGNFRRG